MSSRTPVVVALVAGGVVLAVGGAAVGFVAGVATARATDPSPVASVPVAVAPALGAAPDPVLDAADDVPAAPVTEALPHVALALHTDGCGVIRPEMAPEPQGLTWSVVDADGFQVLGRNAIGETHYRYFTPGTYTVELQAWGGAGYVPISDPVTITC